MSFFFSFAFFKKFLYIKIDKNKMWKIFYLEKETIKKNQSKEVNLSS